MVERQYLEGARVGTQPKAWKKREYVNAIEKEKSKR